jgi:isoaspartyl peptidase/L-asparaginase-like protein (Ntn-hydrolase superfamily)
MTKMCFSTGGTPTASAIAGLALMGKRVGGAGGAVVVDKQGKPGFAFTSERMAWALISKDKAQCGINPNEVINF